MPFCYHVAFCIHKIFSIMNKHHKDCIVNSAWQLVTWQKKYDLPSSWTKTVAADFDCWLISYFTFGLASKFELQIRFSQMLILLWVFICCSLSKDGHSAVAAQLPSPRTMYTHKYVKENRIIDILLQTEKFNLIGACVNINYKQGGQYF